MITKMLSVITEPYISLKISAETWSVMIPLAFIQFDKIHYVNEEQNA